MRRLLVTLAVLAAGCGIVAPVYAQTITASLPDSIAVGAHATVTPEARDAIGRVVPKPRGRVFLTCDAPGIVSAAVDRLTANAAGSTVCRALWDRSDYARIEVSHLVRVYAPPVVPVAIELAPATALAITVGDSARITVTAVTLATGGTRRPAAAAELAAYPVRWSASGTAATVSAGVVRGAAPGLSLVTACVDAVCAVRGVNVSAPVGELVGSLPCRPLVATELARVEADAAVFVRALPGLPTARYCVDNRLAVVLEGDLVVPGEVAGTGAITTVYFAPGAALPVVVP